MITTVTLNTSVDKLYLVEKLEDYTVMRVKKVSNTVGGKGLNISKVELICWEKRYLPSVLPAGLMEDMCPVCWKRRESGLNLPVFRRKPVPVSISGSFQQESIRNF